jgi:hypothetical protein
VRNTVYDNQARAAKSWQSSSERHPVGLPAVSQVSSLTSVSDAKLETTFATALAATAI